MFTLYNYCVPCLLEHLTLYLQTESRLHIAEFSGYHCIIFIIIIFPSGDKMHKYGIKFFNAVNPKKHKETFVNIFKFLF